MSNQGTSSSSRLLMVGAVVLLLGVILVLLVLRNDDGDGGPSASPTPSSSPTATASPSETPSSRPSLVTPEQAAAARIGDLVFDEGLEATAVRVNFMRGVAALPLPGDHVNLYVLPQPDEQPTAEGEATDPVTGEPLPDAELLLRAVEVLGVTGPLPAANDGTLTLILALPEADVPPVLEAANRSELWVTLLPNPDAAAASIGTDQ